MALSLTINHLLREQPMIEFVLPDMTCGHCAAVVRRTVMAVDDAAALDIDLQAQRVRIDSEASVEELAQALTAAGYPPNA